MREEGRGMREERNGNRQAKVKSEKLKVKSKVQEGEIRKSLDPELGTEGLEIGKCLDVMTDN